MTSVQCSCGNKCDEKQCITAIFTEPIQCSCGHMAHEKNAKFYCCSRRCLENAYWTFNMKHGVTLVEDECNNCGCAICVYVDTKFKIGPEYRRAGPQKASEGSGGLPQDKTAPKKLPAKKPAPGKIAPAKKSPAKKVPAKKAPAKKEPAKKLPAKKSPAKKKEETAAGSKKRKQSQ